MPPIDHQEQIVIRRARPEGRTVWLDVEGAADGAPCPSCGGLALKVHDRDQRCPRDVPWRRERIRRRGAFLQVEDRVPPARPVPPWLSPRRRAFWVVLVLWILGTDVVRWALRSAVGDRVGPLARWQWSAASNVVLLALVLVGWAGWTLWRRRARRRPERAW